MDIRNFFGGGSAAKKTTPVKESDQKKTGGKTKAKQKTPTSKKQPQNDKKTPKDKKPKPQIDKKTPRKDKKPKPAVDEDDDVEIIDLSEDEKSKVETAEENKKPAEKNLEGKGRKKQETAQKQDGKANGHSEAKISKKKKTENSSNDEVKAKPKEKDGKKKGIIVDSDSDGEMLKHTKKRHRSKKSSISISDSDSEEPVPQKKKRKSRKIQVLNSDSESEEPVPHKQKRRRKRSDSFCNSDEEVSTIKDAFAKATPKTIKPNLKPKSVSPPRKSVDITDFFGMGAIQRSERKTAAVKRKAESSPDKSDKDGRDVEMHDEDSFEKTLQELDKRKPVKKAKTESAKEESVRKTEGKSLASKLAEKSKVFVPDTPDKPIATSLKKPETPKTKQHGTSERTSVKVTPTKTPVKVSPGKPTTSSTSGTPGKNAPNAVYTTPSHAQKTSPTKSDVGTPGDTPLQRRGSNYRAYQQREGPRALGSKEIPEGAENCLEDLTFVITGVLESMERDEAKSLIEKYGGRVTGSLSKRTTYLLAGRDAGDSKLAKAESLGTKHLDEDGLLDLIRSRPGKKSKYLIAAEKEANSVKSTKKVSETIKKEAGSFSSPVSLGKHQSPSTSHSSPSLHKTSSPAKKLDQSTEALLWVDKYKPTSLKQIIGQQGDKSNARKLCHWLKTWHQNRASGGKKPTFNRFNDDGSGSKAALLSGPPGVGKTTTAQLVCQEVGFSFVELNASDTRSKKNLEQEVAEALGNHTLVDYFDEQKSGAVSGHKHCLIMDEVDGMAGSEDRGGMQELIQLIKGTKIPIICMCNDRNHTKVRSLSNHCFDLRFQRPRLEQIKSAMMSISFKERIKIPPAALNEVILAANQDVRQVIHNLSMWSSNEKNLSYEQIKEDASKAKKDFKLSPFDACRKVFVGGEETAKMTIHDKADLFFNDYSLSPLFVQENYLQTTPFAARGDIKKHLDMVSRAADSIADGDLVGRHVRQNGKWNLLPLQAIFSSVTPGDCMRGSIGMIQFPAWLGKNSSRNKIDRLLQELRTHMRLKLSADKRGLNMEYLPHMRRKLTAPLVNEGPDGVQEAVAVLNEYDLLREDFDNILEISSWPGMKDPMSQVESKVKAAFTRTYNKDSHMTPYSTVAMSKKSKKRGGGAELEEGMEGEEEGVTQEDEEDEEDITADAMIKQKKKPAARGKGKASSTGETSGKDKGRGRGKGKR